MGFTKHGDVEKHEVVTPDENTRLNDKLSKTGHVSLDDLPDTKEDNDTED